MKTCPYSAERERIVANAILPVASELRLLDASDIISLLRFECYGNLAELVSSAAELYFHPGTINFGSGGDYTLEWNGVPEVTLDLEIKPKGVTVYARLTLAAEHAAIEINHVAFQEPAADPRANTAFLERSLNEARFSRTSPSPLLSDAA
ncbi:hypothetical protein MRS76_15630 [Rhizobiaceae bacterium n13]|uniref:Uncharacterized protein n=1 Tax=Ferirhizobium litorale TaxID=2927786 RepID=A0AAE3QAS2_9HYPH|nr:hypothetical protein [Fererhizobium litorale]MDI7863386.1 hypothetical protein [Fererhizobium litorale]MDI7922337.1 hypothetical protein [Fererhizobium litorale]